jgi:hypothetical protein
MSPVASEVVTLPGDEGSREIRICDRNVTTEDQFLGLSSCSRCSYCIRAGRDGQGVEVGSRGKL